MLFQYQQNQLKSSFRTTTHRWINRGGYDLLGAGVGRDESIHGIPKAHALYGDLATQSKDSNSFVSRLKIMLSLRKSLGIAESELMDVPTVTSPGIVILINKLPASEDNSRRWQITALNFGDSSVQQSVAHPEVTGDAKVLWSSLTGSATENVVATGGELVLELQSLEAKLIVASAR